jgi:lysozyme family protein
MINLSYETAIEIFKNNYWTPINLELLKNQSIANIIYDGCINQGRSTMRSVVKNAAEENGIKIGVNDNIFSDKIINKLNNLDQKKLFNSIKKHRKIKYENSKTFKKHGNGWLKRLDSILYID